MKINRISSRIASLLLAVLLAFSMTVSASAAGDFPDAPRSQWYGSAVYTCVEKGYVRGFEDGTFKPCDSITYAQLMSMLRGGVYADTEYAKQTFPNMPWWYPGLYTCRQVGALEGTQTIGDVRFEKELVTRYEMAQVISNVMKTKGLTVGDSERHTASGKISDWDAVPANYRDAVASCYALGIINGFEDGSFGGEKILTRAQVCVVMVAMDDAIANPPSESANTTKVAYGKENYPDLSNIDYGTSRKLNYQEEDQKGKSTYFYDFRNTWYAGASINAPTKGIYTGQPGLYGVVASTDGNTLTFTAYTEIPNAKVTSAKFLTYDNAKAITLEATANKEITTTTTKLANGPYVLGIWFSYTDANGKSTTVSVGRTLYVSNGNGYFADRAYQSSDNAMESFLTKERNSIAADDAFQAWVAKQGGNDLTKATSLANISFPFMSGTTRYPNDAPKWRQLAHEICPDAKAGDYTKAAALFDWMNSNLAYDTDTSTGTGDYRWATAGGEGSATGFTTWDSHIGKCEDFANIYTIMCRELGIPSHVMTDQGHAWSIIYIRGCWETVDPTATMRRSNLGTDNKSFIANAKAFWANQKTGDAYDTRWYGFMQSAKLEYYVGSWEKYTTIEEKFADTNYFDPLDYFLHDPAYYTRWDAPLYNH